MQRILLLIILLAPALTTMWGQTQKMSPLVRETMLKADEVQRAKGQQPSSRKRMTAFVRTSDAGALHRNDCHILASFGDIHIASIPVSRLRSLAQCSTVSRIEAGRSCTAQLDSAAMAVNVSPVWAYQSAVPAEASQPVQTGLTGKGVVVGLMDIGFDLTHPIFYSSDGSRYRIKALWDQLDLTPGGQPVTGQDTTYIGRQYIGEEALLALGHTYDGYIVTHGTHTAGTAAGGTVGFVPQAMEALQKAMPYGIDTRYFSGMAPDADICLVANATTNNADSIPEENDALYTTALDALGFKYLFDYADAHGQPCVASFSEGSYPDMAGEDQLYAEVLNSMLGPGHILVASAGNECRHWTYVSKPLGKEKAGAFIYARLKSSGYTIRSSDKMTLRLTTYPDNADPIVRDYHTDQCIWQGEDSDVFTDTITIDKRQLVVYMAAYPSCYNPEDWVTELYIKALDDRYVGYKPAMSITLLGDTVSSEIFSTGGFFDSNKKDPTLCDFESTHNIHTPSGLPGVISVGSVNTRQNFGSLSGDIQHEDFGPLGHHSTFSSIGPSMCGEPKPDVAAPGSIVVCSYSSFFHEKNPNPWDITTFDWNGRTYLWTGGSGTSMATPIVAGIIATWLQVCPTLTPAQAMEAIAATATKPEDFNWYPVLTDGAHTRNYYHGYGVIDAYAGLQYVLSHFTAIQTVERDDSPAATYDIMGRRISTLRPGNIYIRNGKKIVIR